MASLYPIPTFATGFARNTSQSLFPSFWKGLKAIWAPYVGIQGQILYELRDFGNDGVLTNMTNDNWVVGKNGYALNFTAASNNYVDCGSNSSLDDLLPYTYVVGIKPTTIPTSIFMAKGDNNGQGHLIVLSGGGFGIFRGFSGANLDFKSSLGLISAGNRAVVAAIVKTDRTAELYLDGSEVTYSLTQAGTGNLVSDVGTPLHFGRRPRVDSPLYYNGEIEFAYVWDRELSPVEIAFLNAVPHAPLILEDDLLTFLVLGRVSRYHDLSGIGGQGQMTWNPLG